jgi:hypothetical protein
MTPQERCIRRIDEARNLSDSSVIHLVQDALSDLEQAYSRTSERVVALEAVHSAFFARRRRASAAPFGRFVAKIIDRRQDDLLRRSA